MGGGAGALERGVYGCECEAYVVGNVQCVRGRTVLLFLGFRPRHSYRSVAFGHTIHKRRASGPAIHTKGPLLGPRSMPQGRRRARDAH